MNLLLSLPHSQITFFFSIYLSIYLSLSLFQSVFLSLKPPCRVQDDYYVNECDWREGRRDGGVRHIARGVLLFLFSLSLSIVPRITAISMPEEYFNIRYSNTHSVTPPSLPHNIYPPTRSSIHPSIHTVRLPAVDSVETNVQRREEEDVDICKRKKCRDDVKKEVSSVNRCY